MSERRSRHDPPRPHATPAPRVARPGDAPLAHDDPASDTGRAHADANGDGRDDPASAGNEPADDRADAREPAGHRDADALVRELTERLAIQRTAEIHGLLEIIGRKRKLFAVNLLAGLARGVGFFLGLTLVGGLVIGATAMTFDFVAETLGLHDVNFTSLMRRFAEKAVEAELVWEDVRNERRDETSPDVAATVPPEHEPSPPRDEGGH